MIKATDVMKDSMKHVIDSISTFQRFWYFIYYSVVRHFYNYVRYFETNSLFFNYNNKLYTSEIGDFVLIEKGIYFTELEYIIPYEYIYRFQLKDDRIKLTVLGNIIDDHFCLTDDLLDIYIWTNENPKVFTMIKRNLFYHILYNKVNEKIFEYKNVRKTKTV